MKIDVKKLYERFGAELKYSRIVVDNGYILMNDEGQKVVENIWDVFDVSMNDESVLLSGNSSLFRLSLEEYLYCKEGYMIVEGTNMFGYDRRKVVLTYHESLEIYRKMQLNFLKDDAERFCSERGLDTLPDSEYEHLACLFLKKEDCNTAANDTWEAIINEYIRTKEKRRLVEEYCSNTIGDDGYGCNCCVLGQDWCLTHPNRDECLEDSLDKAILLINNASYEK